jgi:hypothetical protein
MGAPQYEQAGADVSGSGTPGTIPVWSSGTTLTDSIVTQTGTSRVNIGSGSYAGASVDGLRLVNGANSYIAASDGTRTLLMGANGAQVLVGSLTNHALVLKTNNIDAVTILPGSAGVGGNVGIGTASPSTRLHVSDNSSIPVIVQSSGSTDSYLRFINTSNNLGYIGYVGTNLYLAPNNGAGNVGIGTASPNFRLTVQGAAGSIAQFSNGANADLLINLTAGVSLITPATGTLALGTSSVERARIDSAGNVCINTTNARTSRFSVEQTGTGTKMATFSNAVDADFEIKSGSAGLLTIGTGTGTLLLQSGGTERARIDTNGNIVCNTAAIATNATNGFLYVPSCAGTPTGTPTTYTGRVPIVVDTTNHKLYFYSGGVWRDAGP